MKVRILIFMLCFASICCWGQATNNYSKGIDVKGSLAKYENEIKEPKVENYTCLKLSSATKDYVIATEVYTANGESRPANIMYWRFYPYSDRAMNIPEFLPKEKEGINLKIHLKNGETFYAKEANISKDDLGFYLTFSLSALESYNRKFNNAIEANKYNISQFCKYDIEDFEFENIILQLDDDFDSKGKMTALLYTLMKKNGKASLYPF